MQNILRTSDAARGAKVCAIEYGNVKEGDNVLILTDTRADFRITEVLSMVCKEVGAKVTTMVMDSQALPHQEPPPPVREALKAADLVLAPLVNGIAHTNAVLDAHANGTRYMSIPGEAFDSFDTEGARFPAEIIFEVAKKVGKQWSEGKTMHITSERGTDLTAQILKPEYVTGWQGTSAPLGTKVYPGTHAVLSGLFGVFAGGFGVVGMWPAWTSNGVMYFDAVQTFPNLLDTPLKFAIKNGEVVDMDGAREQVKFFENIFERYGDKARHHAELMIGLNPKARLYLADGSHLEAHRRAGTLHSAVGNQEAEDYVSDEERVWPGVHIDNLVINPTITIDDEICMERGRLKVYYDDPDIQRLLEKHGITL